MSSGGSKEGESPISKDGVDSVGRQPRVGDGGSEAGVGGGGASGADRARTG